MDQPPGDGLLRMIARALPSSFHLTNSGVVSRHGFAAAIIAAAFGSALVTGITTAEYATAAPHTSYSVNRV